MKTRLRPKGQITLPPEVRDHLHLREGDDVAFTFDDDGRVIMTGLTTIPSDQAWFWTDDWQAGEREATAEIGQNAGEVYEDEAEFLAALDVSD